jgi:hypothetical protein
LFRLPLAALIALLSLQAAADPAQLRKIAHDYQIMHLLGRYRDSEGAGFRLGAFHDKLISYGTLPLSVVEWLMFDDESSFARR